MKGKGELEGRTPLALGEGVPCDKSRQILGQSGLHHLMEAFEEVTPVVGTGGRFGMILHAHDGQGLVAQAFQGLVVEVDVGGFHIVQAVQHHMEAVVLGRDVVSQDDPAFQNPTKPVGAFYDKETADRIAAEKGYTMVEDAGRGYRQVVPSPKPFDIVEAESIKALFNAGHVVIAVGGGGIPVVRRDGKLCGTPAVIDKDFGSELLAELLDADILVILTAVEKVAINFNKPDQKGLDDLTPAQAKVYMDENQFAKGSMLPKVQAAVKFAESKPGRTALITLLEKAKDGIAGKTGTRIHQ